MTLKPIENYEGYYAVSSLGYIISLSRELESTNGVIKTFKQRILKPNKYGYVTLCRDGIRECKSVKKSVDEAFNND